MSGFTIPNTPDAFNQNQAEPDSLDFQILGKQVNGVVSGMAVTQSGSTINVASGEVLINGAYYSYDGATNIPVTVFSSSSFFDLVVARLNTTTSLIEITVLSGNSTANQRFPSVNHTTDVVLASIWRTGNTVSTSEIVDKRIFVRSTTARTASNTVSSNRGSTGDLYVNTTWTPSTTSTASPLSVKVGSTWYNLAYWAPNTNIATTGNITATTFIGNLTGNVTGNVSGTAGGVAWGNVSGKPTDFVFNNSGTYSINITGSAGSAGSATTAGSTATLSNGSGGGQVFGTGGFDLRPGTYNGETLSVWRGTSQASGAFTQAWRNSGGTTLSYISSTGAFIGPSDRSLKKNIKDANYESLYNVIDNIKVKTFEYKHNPGVKQLGIIAQEILDYIPEIVDGEEGSYGVNEVKFVYPLIAKVQQLEARLQALENVTN